MFIQRLGPLLFLLAALVTVIGAGPSFAASNDTLDPTFSVDGIYTAPSTDITYAVAEQADGKVIIAGGDESSPQPLTVRRLNADGTPDLSFGVGGLVELSQGIDDEANDIAIQPDGKIVIAAYMNVVGADTAVIRLLQNGDPDPTFGGGDGLAIYDLAGTDIGYAVRIQSDGKIIVGGTTNSSPTNRDFLLSRLLPNGDLDTTFAGDGSITIPRSGRDRVLDLALYDDGRILAVGHVTNAGTDTALWRVLPDGSMDPSFGIGGMVTTSQSPTCSDYAIGAAILPDERIVIGKLVSNCTVFSVGAARYLPDGTLDPTFGTGGHATSTFTGPGSFLGQAGMIVQPDGKIVVANSIGGSTDDSLAFFRVTPDGAPDTTWGPGGERIVDIGKRYEQVYDLWMSPSGRMLAAGLASDTSPTAPDTLFAVRLNVTVDTTPPAVTLVGSHQGTTANFVASASDDRGLADQPYSWDNGETWTNTSQLSVPSTGLGSPIVRTVLVRDREDNRTSASAEAHPPTAPDPTTPPTISVASGTSTTPGPGTSILQIAIDTHGATLSTITTTFKGRPVAGSPTHIDLKSLPEGRGKLRVVVVTSTGLRSTFTLVLTIDRTPPRVSAPSRFVLGPTTTLSITDTLSGTKRTQRRLRIDGLGRRRIPVRVQDKAGNTATRYVRVERRIALSDQRLNRDLRHSHALQSYEWSASSVAQALRFSGPEAPWYGRSAMTPILVREVQWRLQSMGFQPRAYKRNGRLDIPTIRAVQRYQRARNLPPLGTVGPRTRAMLDRDLLALSI